MVVELVAGRLIARHVGSSLYTWTSVIGIVLAGIAIGNYVGGRLADRFRANEALASLFLLSSGLCLLVPLFNERVGSMMFLREQDWALRIAANWSAGSNTKMSCNWRRFWQNRPTGHIAQAAFSSDVIQGVGFAFSACPCP
jgi:predicted MFS family arabinose efflux permease